MNKNSSFYHVVVSFLSGAFGALLVVVLVLASVMNQKQTLLNSLLQPFEQALTSPKPAANVQSATQESMVIDAVKKTKPAVVSIIISADVPKYSISNQNNPLNDFFGNGFPFNIQVPRYRENGTQKQEIGGGSGFLVSADGLIITNKHVVDQANATYTVFTNDGQKHEAKVIAKDPINDLAVIKIDGANYPYLNFSNSDNLQTGQTVIAIGNALAEFRNTVSVGVISGLARSVTAGNGSGQSEQLDNVIQTDAAINPGNSGGPLLNLEGQVVGVNVAIAQGSNSIGFALPGQLAKSVVDSIKATGKIVRPYLGVRYVIVTPELKDANKLSVDYGALIQRGANSSELGILPGSPADKAGLLEDDIILEADGTKLTSDQSLSTIVRSKKVGDKITLLVLSKGKQKTVTVTLAEMPQ